MMDEYMRKEEVEELVELRIKKLTEDIILPALHAIRNVLHDISHEMGTLCDSEKTPLGDTPPITTPSTPPSRNPNLSLINEPRIELLTALRGREQLTVTEIRRMSRFKADNYDYHLKILITHGFVEKKRGTKTLVHGGHRKVNYYSITPKGIQGLEYFGGDINETEK